MLERGIGAGQDEGDNGRLMAIALRETDRLNQLIVDFLQFARPGPLRIESVDVRKVIEEVLESFESARPAGIRPEVCIERGIEVSADSAQLSQVLWNLVLNASQAMPDGGALRISVALEPEPVSQEAGPKHRRVAEGKNPWVEICVADEGVGIATEVLEHIFDPFFTTRCDGSGLGLPTVHRIVEGHGGTVRVESRVGCGTVIRLRMPGVTGV